MIITEEGDAIKRGLEADKPTILCHIVNNSGGWGRGFVVPLGKMIPEAERDYREWHKSGVWYDFYLNKWGAPFKLGHAQFVAAEANKNLLIANMCAQDGYDGIPVRYWAITECMRQVFKIAFEHKADIIMPRIGCGLGGGSWEEVEKAIYASFPQITVIDLPSK